MRRLPLWLVTLALCSPVAALDQVHFEEVAAGFDRVTALASVPALPEAVFVTEQIGRVRLIEQGALRGEPVLDISDRVRSTGFEQGLTGLALPPAFPAQPYLYVHYIDADQASVIARFELLPGPLFAADPDSEFPLLVLPQPSPIHNCNTLVFGPDSFLYIGCGDGGPGTNPINDPQSSANLYGKILRLDVNNVMPGQPYAIPADNPFTGVAGAAPEVWLRGLRNPYKFSFDPLTGDLWLGDVGQETYEEIDFVPGGDRSARDFGWNTTEGYVCFPLSTPSCDQSGLSPPLWEYVHTGGRCAVVGGVRLRGTDLPGLDDGYVYADFCSGELFSASEDGPGWTNRVAATLDASITVVAQTAARELWIGTYGLGDAAVYRVIAGDAIFANGFELP